MNNKSGFKRLWLLCFAFCWAWMSPAYGHHTYLQHKEFQRFLTEMEKKEGFDRMALVNLFSEVRRQDKIIELMKRPAEKTKTWGEYRPIFVNDKSVQRGLAFWAENEETLKRASKKYNVPPEIMVAIIGVETRYGRIKGGFRVIDALSTLAFSYPPRAKFFRKELVSFLKLGKESGIPVDSVKGSYAGAMGYPQFIPSSYRHYAVDFDKDGRTDLVNSVEDAIGSVGHYFHRHGWRENKIVTRRVSLSKTANEPALAAMANESLKPKLTVDKVRKMGVVGLETLPADLPLALFRFDNLGQIEYWAGFDNYYVITRYNHSRLYAMAVFQLAETLREQRQKGV